MAKHASPPGNGHPPGSAKMPTPSGELGKRQRVRTGVPNPPVTLQLGARLNGDSPFGFDGFSLKSCASHYTKVLQDTLFDLFGNAVFQSHSYFQQWSSRDMDLGTASNLSLFAKNHLWVVSGMGEEPMDHEEHGEEIKTNPTQEFYEDLVKHAKHAHKRMSDIGFAIGVAKKVVYLTKPSGLEKWTKNLLGWGEFLYATGKKLGPKKEGKSQLNLYGKDGIEVVSPEEISLIANDATKIFGAEDVKLMAGLKVGIDAGAEASIFAVGEAVLSAGGYAEIKGGREVGISALHGPVDIRGSEIEIGRHVRNLNQAETTEIKASASESIELRAERIEIGAKEEPKLGKADPPEHEHKPGGGGLREALLPKRRQEKAKEVSIQSSERIKLDSEDKIHVEAAKNAIVRVGDFHIMVTGKQVRLGHKAMPPTAVITLEENAIDLIVGHMRVTVGTGRNQVEMVAGSSRVILKETGTVSVRSENINLG